MAGLSTVALTGVGSAAEDPVDVVDGLFDDDDVGGDEEECHHVVDPDGDGDHVTIQAAVDAASPGENVCVLAGQYDENVQIGTDELTVWAVQGSSDTVVGAPGTVIDVTGEDVVFGNFTVDAREGTGISAGEGTGIRNCRIETDSTVGVDAEDVRVFGLANNVLVDDDVQSQSGHAVHLRRVGGDRESDAGAFVLRNEIRHHYHGVFIEDCETVGLKQNLFQLNYYEGVRVASTETGGSAETIELRSNEFDRNGNAVLCIEEGDSAIRNVYAEANVFDSYVYGIFTSPGREEVDGVTWLKPGEMTEPVQAPCNYWGSPTGPKRNDNALGQRNWFTRQVDDGGDRVTGGVDVRPWAVQPAAPGEEVVCHGGRESGNF